MIEERDYLIHPHSVIVVLIISSITALFLGFSMAYLYSRLQNNIVPVRIPELFYYNSILLLGSSATLIFAKKAYLNDHTVRFKIMLWITLVLTVFFLCAQIQAWQQLRVENVQLTTSNLASYLYVISGLHFAHVIAGIPFLSYYIWVAHQKLKEPVSVLIYFSDPDKKRKLNLLGVYWHFLDVLWIYLLLFFMINYLVG